MMKKLVNLLPAISLAVAMIGAHPVAAAANDQSGDEPEVVGTIQGVGRADMTDLVAAGLTGGSCNAAIVAAQHCAVSTFGIDFKLFSDHSARGSFNCVDIVGDPKGYPGKVSGRTAVWSMDAQGVSLHFLDGQFALPSGVVVATGLHFTVTIQRFGGAGVGHWTLVGKQVSRFNGGPICQELLTRGRIVGKGEIFRERDEE